MAKTSGSIEFFFYPTSYYSQKARLALEEKALAYKETIVSLNDGENNQPWYIRINQKGEVPTLRVGEDVFGESEKIIELVDSIAPTPGAQLVPDTDTSQGKLVSQWRTLIDDVNVPLITMGVSGNIEFASVTAKSPEKSLLPRPAAVKARFSGGIAKLEASKKQNPSLAQEYESKIAVYRQRVVDFFDAAKVREELLRTDHLVDKIEKHLRDHPDWQWMCGDFFTAADINLTVLLGRFHLLGLLPRYADPMKRPLLVKYWDKAVKRPSVQKVVVGNIAETKRYIMKKNVIHYGKRAIGIGAVAFAVWFIYKRHSKSSI